MFNFTKKAESMKEDISKKLRDAIQNADEIMVGAGAGMSTAAGFVYAGDRFNQYFSDFEKKYGFHDMYTGGFYNYDTPEEYWGYWCRYIYVNRYMDAPKRTHFDLYELIKEKDYFVLTTNVDHCFQKAGFDKKRLFYTQGDYGLFQCSEPCHDVNYENEEVIRQMILSQGYIISEDNSLTVPEGITLGMTVPTELIPKCPKCGKPMTMNLRADNTFVQDEGWYRASECYENFVRRHKEMNILYLELGVGFNTPGIIKYNFWNLTNRNPKATYACLNFGQAYAPEEIQRRSFCIDGDIDVILNEVMNLV